MDATIVSITEGTPEEYPAAPEGLSTDAAALDTALIWGRLESYIACRYSERAVEWVVEGPGTWRPTLKPAAITTTEIWNGSAWETVTLQPSPLSGYCLPGVGPYRFTGTAGVDDAEVPATVQQAYRRLAEYSAEINFEYLGLRTVSVPEVASEELASPNWRARALQDSGAADLLRNLRRV